MRQTKVIFKIIFSARAMVVYYPQMLLAALHSHGFRFFWKSCIYYARVTLSRNGCAMATRNLKFKTPCCTVICRTITVYHRVISLLAPCISGHFLGLRVCISWWENILWYAKEFVKITTELHLRVISLLPRCSSCRLRAPPWWQRVCSVQTFFPTFSHFSPLFPTFSQFSPLFTTFHHFSPLFTPFHHFSPLSATFSKFFQLVPTFRRFPPLLAT